jgi:putative transposase
MGRKRIIEKSNFVNNDLDTSKWLLVNTDSLSEEKRETFLKRKEAVDLYIYSELTLGEIEEKTGIIRRDITRFVNRCIQVDDSGELQGYRSLIPYRRINEYQRETLPSLNSVVKRMNGAFGLLLEKYPNIKQEIENKFFGRNKEPQSRMMRVKDLHKSFLEMCRKEGIDPITDYPFITQDKGKRALERYVNKLMEKNFAEAAKRNGDDAAHLALNTGMGEKNTQLITRPFQRVQFDGHKIDVIITLKFRDPDGHEHIEIMDRVYLLVIIDTLTRLVMGYHLCLKREYSAEDVLHCIKNAIMPKEDFQFTIPNLKISEQGGFHSTKFPEDTQWAVWDELLYDNAKSNLSKNVTSSLEEVIGCSVNAGPVGSPTSRPIIERFFGLLEENGFHQLPNTTGSNPSDPRRKDAEKNALKYEISEKEIEELTEALIAEYNGTPHTGIGYLSPLEALEQKIKSGEHFRRLPEEKQKESIFFSMKVKRRVCGSINKGRRPYINYEGVQYRSNKLAQMPQIIGKTLDLIVNIDDLRAIRAFLPDGSELGLLEASGKWCIQKHSLKLRQVINKLKNKKLIHFTERELPIEVYKEYLKEKSKTSKSARNDLAKVQRMLKKSNKKISKTAPLDKEIANEILEQKKDLTKTPENILQENTTQTKDGVVSRQPENQKTPFKREIRKAITY